MRNVLPVLLLCAACGPSLETAADPSRSGTPGEDGPWGARVTTENMPLGALPPRRVTLVMPDDGHGGRPDHVDGIVFVQGGLVDRHRYDWLARHLATRGFAVVLPEYTGWLAFFEPGVTAAAVEHLRHRVGPSLRTVTSMGHSLGGVMAARAAATLPDVDALVLLASEATAEDAAALSIPVVVVAGTADQSEGVDRAHAAFDALQPGAWFATVLDLTHFSWTDPGHDPTVLREREPPPADLSLVRHRGLHVVDSFLDWAVRGRSASLGDLLWPPEGVTTERHR